MIFLDTSAIYALADTGDPNHNQALSLFASVVEEGQGILTHNYVVVESAALLQSRLGMNSALRFLVDVNDFQVHWITSDDHQRAVSLLTERARRGLSLVDCVSFVVMGQYGVEQALAFDRDFEREGFRLYPGPLNQQ